MLAIFIDSQAISSTDAINNLMRAVTQGILDMHTEACVAPILSQIMAVQPVGSYSIINKL